MSDRQLRRKELQFLYLPPYSPNINPLEMLWSKIKAFLRRRKARETTLLANEISDAYFTVSCEDILGFFLPLDMYSLFWNRSEFFSLMIRNSKFQRGSKGKLLLPIPLYGSSLRRMRDVRKRGFTLLFYDVWIGGILQITI